MLKRVSRVIFYFLGLTPSQKGIFIIPIILGKVQSFMWRKEAEERPISIRTHPIGHRTLLVIA